MVGYLLRNGYSFYAVSVIGTSLYEIIACIREIAKVLNCSLLQT